MKTSCNKMFYCITTYKAMKWEREVQTKSSKAKNVTLQFLYSMEYYHRVLRPLLDINNRADGKKKEKIPQGYNLTLLKL